MIALAFRTVLKRWAMTNTVLPSMSWSIPFSISASVLVSTEDVASSRISTGGSATAARAIARSWRWPWERLGSVGGQHRVVAVRQTADEGIRIRNFGRMFNFFLRGIEFSKTDVFCYGSREQMGILQNDTEGVAQSVFSISFTSMPS